MSRLIGLLFASALAAGIGGLGAASAADLPLKAKPAPVAAPVYNWTGFYIGLNGGGGWGTTDHTDLFGVTTHNFSTSGGLIGGTYGINGQFGKFVIGYEGDFDWANINGTFNSAVLCSVSGGTTCFTNLENFSTARVRAGIDLNGWLLFGTAGYGFGQVRAGQNPCALTIFGGFSCNEMWRSGWVAGGGVEKMFAPNWSVKVEYLHFDFGNKLNYTPATIAGGNSVYVLERGDLVRAGVNYHFNWATTPVVAKY
jgi:outer membrane immunogenic protein